MKPSRAAYHLALLSLLLSIALAFRPTITQAADGDTTTTLALPPADTGLREPSSGGSLIIRGTRPVRPASTQVPNVRSQEPPPLDMGWRPEQRIGPGWSTDYDWGGLTYAPTPGR